jgi:hypothetical protein
VILIVLTDVLSASATDTTLLGNNLATHQAAFSGLHALASARFYSSAAWLLHRNQQLCLFGNVSKVGNQVAANLTGFQVLFFRGVSTRLNDERQDALEFPTSHVLSPNAKHLHRYVNEFSFRLNEGDVKRHTLERLDSFVAAIVGKHITYKELTA